MTPPHCVRSGNGLAKSVARHVVGTRGASDGYVKKGGREDGRAIGPLATGGAEAGRQSVDRQAALTTIAQSSAVPRRPLRGEERPWWRATANAPAPWLPPGCQRHRSVSAGLRPARRRWGGAIAGCRHSGRRERHCPANRRLPCKTFGRRTRLGETPNLSGAVVRPFGILCVWTSQLFPAAPGE